MWIPAVAETWRRVWGDGKSFRGPRFLNDVLLGKNFHFQSTNFWWPFLTYRQGFSDFPFLFPDFPYIFTILNVVYDHFLTRKTPFLLCSYFRAHPTTLLLKILGRRMHGPSPTSNFGGDCPPVPLVLRPWMPATIDRRKGNRWISCTTAKTVVALGINNYS